MLKRIKKHKVLVFLILIPFLVLVGTFGRFVYNEIQKHYFNSKNFYFESDKLKTELATYQINNYNGVDNYNISINLNSFKNNILKATSDINYEITYTCSTNANCNLSKTDGIIYSSANSDNFIATIAPNVQLHDKDVIWIEIHAKSTFPYEKELSARFVLKVGYYGLSHSIEDESSSPYLELKITNTLDYYVVLNAFGTYNVNDKIDISTYLSLTPTNQAKCASAIIKLDFDPNLVLFDITSEAYDDALVTNTVNIGGFDYINSVTFKMDAVSSQIVRFYKKNSSLDYTYPIINPTSIIIVTYN